MRKEVIKLNEDSFSFKFIISFLTDPSKFYKYDNILLGNILTSFNSNSEAECWFNCSANTECYAATFYSYKFCLLIYQIDSFSCYSYSNMKAISYSMMPIDVASAYYSK